MNVKVTHFFEASCERVFDAWLDPTKVGRFLFRTKTGVMEKIEIDPRVGGRYCIVENRNGKSAEHFGTYLEINRPHRLVFTMEDNVALRSTTVIVEIVAEGTGCRLTLTHEGVTEEFVEKVNAGWSGILDYLESEVA